MLKLSTSYSKKVPVEGQEFSSQSYHASVELELSDALAPADLNNRIHQTFEMVRNAVEDELNGGHVQDQATPEIKPLVVGGEKATNKQVKFLTDLARSQGISLADLNTQAHQLYGVMNIYDLNKRDASRLVDALKRGQRKAA